MVSLETIEREIDELEHNYDTSYRLCERLSWLYTCRDHLRPSKGDERTQQMHGSEFLELASGVSYPALMEVIDEHLQSLKLVYPKSYDAIIDRIRALK